MKTGKQREKKGWRDIAKKEKKNEKKRSDTRKAIFLHRERVAFNPAVVAEKIAQGFSAKSARARMPLKDRILGRF